MKKLFITLVYFYFFCNFVYSQDINSLDLKSDAPNKSKLEKLKKEQIKLINTINDINEFSKGDSSQNIISEEALNGYNSQLDDISKEISETNADLDNTSKLKLIGNISVDPSNSSYLFTPQLIANYKSPIDNSKGYIYQYEFSLNINAPIQSKDSVLLIKNILKAGADGSFNLGGKFGTLSKSQNFGAIISAFGKLNWLYSKNFDSTYTNSFGYFNLTGLAAVKLTPIVVSLQYEYNFSSESTTNFLSNNLNNSTALNLLIGGTFSNYQFQIKYLIHSDVNNVNTNTDENFEIKFGVNYDPFN